MNHHSWNSDAGRFRSQLLLHKLPGLWWHRSCFFHEKQLGGLVVFVPGETVSLRCMFGLFWFDGISNYDKFIIKWEPVGQVVPHPCMYNSTRSTTWVACSLVSWCRRCADLIIGQSNESPKWPRFMFIYFTCCCWTGCCRYCRCCKRDWQCGCCGKLLFLILLGLAWCGWKLVNFAP